MATATRPIRCKYLETHGWSGFRRPGATAGAYISVVLRLLRITFLLCWSHAPVVVSLKTRSMLKLSDA
jgi:hypothetical protein